jgi:hypothetical protein
MNAFIHHTIDDLRGGRSTWRVLLTVSLPSFILAVGAALIRL